jgi:hypothetical protein
MLHRCDNCEKKWPIENLVWIPSHELKARVDPGGIMPSGECPLCGALCYPEKSSKRSNKTWVEVKIHRLKKYPFRCSRIKFEMVADGSEYDAVEMLMAYLDAGRYSFVEH